MWSSSSLVPGAWCWSQSLVVELLLSPVPLNVTSGLFISTSPVAECARDKPWRCWASGSFHLVLYYCKHWGFGWLNIYSGGVTAIPRCHFTGADVCAAWLQTSVNLWWLFAPPPNQTLSLVSWYETTGFLLLGNVNPVLCPHGIQQWTLAEVWTVYRVWSLGESQGCWTIFLDSQVQSNCVENPTGSSINSLLL